MRAKTTSFERRTHRRRPGIVRRRLLKLQLPNKDIGHLALLAALFFLANPSSARVLQHQFLPSLDEPPDPVADSPCKRMPKPCTVLSDTTSTTAFKSAIQSTPLNGGTIVVMPGTYTVDKEGFTFLSNRDWLYIVGLKGPGGELPSIRGKERTEGKPFDGVNNLVYWAPTNGNLILKNLELTGAASNCLASGSGKRKQIVQLHNVNMHHCGHHIWMHGYEPANSWDDEVYVEDSSFHHSGMTHNIYIDRIAKATFVRIQSYSPRSLHAFKCVAIECNLISSHISNASPDGSWDGDSPQRTQSGNSSGYLGSAPLSLVACQRGHMIDNKIVFRFGPSGRTGHHVAARQPRHSIAGCDQPPYDSDGFFDDDFWLAVRDDADSTESIAKSAHFLVMWWSFNQVTVVRDQDTGPVHMLLNSGTIPVKAQAPGSTKLVYVSRPNRWLERSRDILGNNCFKGFRARDELFLSRPWGAMVNAPPEDPNPGDRIVSIGKNDCTDHFPLPQWFETSNEETIINH